MSRDDRLYLDDIRDAVAAIQKFISGMTFDRFASDRRTVDAVVRNLEVIGEAVRNLSERTKKSAPDIAWRKIAALRNILAHEYFGVNKRIVWDVVTEKLDRLDAVCQELLQHLERKGSGRG